MGDVDVDGKVLNAGEQSYYYLWPRGLQLLGGQESIDNDIYREHPAFEDELCRGTTWTKKATAQLSSSDQENLEIRFLLHANSQRLLSCQLSDRKGDRQELNDAKNGGNAGKGRATVERKGLPKKQR